MTTYWIPRQAFGRNHTKNLKLECRMSNKEFRMTKLNSFCCFLQSSLFDIRPARCAREQISHGTPALNWHGFRSGTKHFAGQRVFCGSLSNLCASCTEISVWDSNSPRSHPFVPPRQVAFAQSSSGPKALLEKADRCADTLQQAKDKKKLRHKWIECVTPTVMWLPVSLRTKRQGGPFTGQPSCRRTFTPIPASPRIWMRRSTSTEG